MILSASKARPGAHRLDRKEQFRQRRREAAARARDRHAAHHTPMLRGMAAMASLP